MTPGRRFELGLVTFFENGIEAISFNEASIFIADCIADTGDDETQISITSTNFSALAIAKQIVERFNATPATPPENSAVEALEPFAAFATKADLMPDDFVITKGSGLARRQLTIGDCRKAAVALSAHRSGIR